MKHYKDYTFSSILPEIFQKYSHRDALGFVDEHSLTYADVKEQIDSVMAFLEEMHLKPGDKAVIYSQNMPNWGIVFLAMQCMGIITVPVLPDFKETELENILKHSEARLVFISQSLEYKLKGIQEGLIDHLIRLDNFEVLNSTYPEAKIKKSSKALPSYDIDENALSVLLYTSGTTGNSKGVMLSQKNIIYNILQSGEVQEINQYDRFLSVLPLSHTYENTIGFLLPIYNGASIKYLRKPPTASVLVPAMKKIKPTLMLTVPLIIEKVYNNSVLPKLTSKGITRALYSFRPTQILLHRLAGKKLYKTFGGHLKFFGIGGAKLDPVVERFLRDAKFPYAIGYGLTETAPLLAGSNPSKTKYQAIGPKVIDCQLKINNPNPRTGEGEIWAKGPNVMLGYYKNEEKTREVMTSDGWFKTGDLGVFDKKGRLSHKGRLKNLIVGANGENIYPEEIESLINNFRHVIESIVIEKKGKLHALVHFNREELEQKFQLMKSDFNTKIDNKIEEISQKVDEKIEELAIELQKYVNARVNKVSYIYLVEVQEYPFQKTATKKIKRYLYF